MISEERIRRLVDYLPLFPPHCKRRVKEEAIKLAVQVAATGSFLPNEVEKLEASKLTVLAAGLATKFLQEPPQLAEFLWLAVRLQITLKDRRDWDLVSQAVTVLVNGQVNTAAIRQVPLIPASSKFGAIEALAKRVANSYPVNYFPKEVEQLFGCKKIVLAVGLAASFLLQSTHMSVMNFLLTEYTKPTEYPATFRFLFTPQYADDWRAVCEAVRVLISPNNPKDHLQDDEAFALSWVKAIRDGTGLLGDICGIVLHLAFGTNNTDDQHSSPIDTESRLFTLNIGPRKLRLTHVLSMDSRGTPFEFVRVPRTGLVLLHAVCSENTREHGYVCVAAEDSTLVIRPSPQRPALRLSFEVEETKIPNVVKFYLPGKPGYYLTEAKGKIFISPFATEFTLTPTLDSNWDPHGCTPLCEINQECVVRNLGCEYYCFRGDCRVLAANGELVRVSELRMGDRVRVLGGKVDVVEACVCTEVAGGVKEMVTLPNGVCLTSGHPVMTQSGRLVEVVCGGVSLVCYSSHEWSRPRELVAPRVEQLSHLFNFALRDRGALLVTGPQKTTTLEPLEGEEEVSLVVCGSLGQSCPGVDDSTSFFGSERVIAALKRNPQWPHIRGKPTTTLSKH